MNREEYFKRTASLLHPDITAGATTAIIGLGSGGARVAEEVARFGTGKIILVDRPGEKLEEHNLIRHPLGYSTLGRLKVQAMRERLLDIYPACQVEIVEADVCDESSIEQIIRDCDQVHLCTDNEPSKHAVNSACVRLGVPMIFAGVFDGGCGGEVGRVLPAQACYACMATHLQRTTGAEAKEPAIDYSRGEQPAARTTAALNIDIAQIALIQARVGLMTLLALNDPDADFVGNYILFGNRPVPGLFTRMLESEIWSIPRRTHCLICCDQPASDVDQLAGELLAEAQTIHL
jgi:molybdopterin/thiamine biosynthesis adenylyltransferase